MPDRELTLYDFRRELESLFPGSSADYSCSDPTASRFPISSARDEPYRLPSGSDMTLTMTASLLKGSSAIHMSANAPIHVPGVVEDGSLTIEHPIIDVYLSALSRALWDNPPIAPPRWPSISAERLKLCMAHYVNALLKRADIGEFTSECIVALAAIKTLFGCRPAAAFFGLWNINVRTNTLKMIIRMKCYDPALFGSIQQHLGRQWYAEAKSRCDELICQSERHKLKVAHEAIHHTDAGVLKVCPPIPHLTTSGRSDPSVPLPSTSSVPSRHRNMSTAGACPVVSGQPSTIANVHSNTGPSYCDTASDWPTSANRRDAQMGKPKTEGKTKREHQDRRVETP
ncbi:hypothetical protein AcW1_003778 [Taiwanofungus camphoratus]|nr:hypothetical protein AcW1_003778 [Antrodia cinnamomea]